MKLSNFINILHEALEDAGDVDVRFPSYNASHPDHNALHDTMLVSAVATVRDDINNLPNFVLIMNKQLLEDSKEE